MKDIFLLDLDDTLLDFGRAERENLTRTLEKFGVANGEAELRLFHEINDSLWKALERGEITRDKLVVTRFKLFFQKLGVSLPPAPAAQAYFDGFCEVCFPFEGAAEFLISLRRRGRVYLVTNGGARIQYRHIADAGFSELLDGVFISEEIGWYKPDSRFAAYVAEHIPHFEASRAVWLGDSLTSDGLCAERAGIDFVLFAPHGVPQGYAGACAVNYAEAEALLLG